MASASEYKHQIDSCPDVRQGAGLRDDPCYLDCQAVTVQKPLKYITRNFHDRGCNPREMCYPGFLPQDGEGWAQCDIDNDSKLRHSKLTAVGQPQQLSALPVPTVPFMGNGCLNTDTEMNLRGLVTYNDKACMPRDTAYHNRRFDFFDHLCYNPVAVKNTVWNGNQAGADTRQQRMEGYKRCDNVGGSSVEGTMFDEHARHLQPVSMNRLNTYDASKYQGNYGNGGYNPNMESITGYAPPGSCSSNAAYFH